MVYTNKCVTGSPEPMNILTYVRLDFFLREIDAVLGSSSFRRSNAQPRSTHSRFRIRSPRANANPVLLPRSNSQLTNKRCNFNEIKRSPLLSIEIIQSIHEDYYTSFATYGTSRELFTPSAAGAFFGESVTVTRFLTARRRAPLRVVLSKSQFPFL